jgi:hypothetical protein
MSTFLAPGDEHASFMHSHEKLFFSTALQFVLYSIIVESAYEMPANGYARC